MSGIITAAAVTAGAAVYSANQAGRAGESVAAGAEGANQLSADQFEQSRQDLSPYRDIAVGREIPQEFDEQGYSDAVEQYDLALEEIRALPPRLANLAGERFAELGPRPNRVSYAQANTNIQYEGGALNELADYGRTQIDQGDFIPASEVPQFGDFVGDLPNINNQVPDFDVQGNIPQYDPTAFDLQSDPSYQFRKAEQDRSINRNFANAGKLLSGNRAEELLSRSGDLASQEYAAARGRGIQDYGIGRENELSRYGRDITGYEVARQNELSRYGRDVSEYDRTYGRGVDRYNAASGREGQLYGRGEVDYSRAYGAEGDYLNRLANLSNVGQVATTQTAQLGAQSAANRGNALISAGNARAAGQIGSANAITQGIGDLTSIGTRYLSTPNQPTGSGGANQGPYGNQSFLQGGF